MEDDEPASGRFFESEKELRNQIKSLGRKIPPRATLVLTLILGLATLLWWTRPLHSDNFVFYLSNTSEVLPIRTIGKTSYLPLLRVLNLVGKVEALKEGRDKLRVWYGKTKLEFVPDSRKVQVDRTTLTLAEPVRVENGQWMVPVDFLGLVLPRIARVPIQYRPGDRRIFIGGAKPGTFAVRLEPLPNGARLMLTFTAPVSLQTAARNGKWILNLGNRAVEPLEQHFHFDNSYVRDLQFDDQDGVPKLIITPASPGMDLYPTLQEDGKLLRADILKSGPTVAERPGVPPATAPPASPGAETVLPGIPTVAPGAPAVSASSFLPVVVLDAGHGGEDIGAQGKNGVVEKNLVAQLVVRVRTALLATQKYRVILTRLGDTDPGFDQRAIIADTAHAAVFLSFHAGNLGFRSPRVVVYTYQSPHLAEAAEPGPRPLFTPWSTAQVYRLADSRRLSQALQEQFSQLPGLAAGKPEKSPVRVLRSINAPAVAIEIGSLAPDLDPTPLLGADFQQQLSSAIVRALDAFSRRPS